jgi:N-acetylglutamate synthase-like GNAT family acetyltransferase
MLRTTVIGCSGLGVFLKDQIAAGPPNRFLVAECDGSLAGMSSWRRQNESLHLNYLYVLPQMQGRGIGRALLDTGLIFRESMDVQWLAVDVHDDNQRARAWYESLGFTPTERRLVVEASIPSARRPATNEWSSTFHEEGIREHARYGFSSFTLKTAEGSYVVGRLGASLFRVTSCSIVHDSIAMEALHSLDPKRALLCFATVEEFQADPGRYGHTLGATERLVASLDVVSDRLRTHTAASSR